MMKTKLTTKLDACEANLKRNHSRLVRITNRITKLTKERRRLMLQLAALPEPKPAAKPSKQKVVPTISTSDPDLTEKVAAALDRPAFLDRSNPVIAEEMTRARKAAEAAERSKMPLTGKAALDAIRPKRKAAKAM